MPSEAKSDDPSLLGRIETLLGRRYGWFCLALALVLVLLLALAAYAGSARGQPVRAALWTLTLNPVIIVYIFLVHPLMHRRWQGAIRSLHALAPAAGGAAERKPVRSRREWAALLLGSLFGVAVAHDTPAGEGWLRLYSAATSALMFALLAAAIYGSLSRAGHLAARSRAGLELDVFDGHLLTPFAQWGQTLSLVFVGGISVSLLFQSYESLRSLQGVVTYGALVIVSVTLFFMSVWTIHVALAKAQKKELARVRRDLAAAREALHRERAGAAGVAVQAPYLPVVVCGLYEKQVLSASTWPFNPTIVGRLFASTVAPLSVYVLKLAFGVGGGL